MNDVFDDLYFEFCDDVCHNYNDPETDTCGDCPYKKIHQEYFGQQCACFAQWLIDNKISK